MRLGTGASRFRGPDCTGSVRPWRPRGGSGASSSSKATLHDPVRDAGPQPAVGPVFLDDHGAVSLGTDRTERVEIERPHGAKVDHFGVDVFLRQLLGGRERGLERARIGDQGDVRPSRLTSALPIGTRCSPSGTSPLSG